MRIGIDFDDTIINIKPVSDKYIKKYKPNLKEEKEKFIKKYFHKITNESNLTKNALKYINLLSQKHELYLITARSEDYGKNIIKSVYTFLKKHNINIDNIHTSCFGEAKKKMCQELKIDLFIDNDTRNIDEVKKITNCILFGDKKDYKHVENFKKENYIMFNDWEKIYKYIKEEKWKKD